MGCCAHEWPERAWRVRRAGRLIASSALIGFASILLAAAAQPVRAQDNDVSPATEARGSDARMALAEQVSETLKSHCAVCHGQAQGASGAPPAGGIGAIDDIDWLAASALVVPGEPDRSRLFAVVQERHAPIAHFAPWGRANGPTGADVMGLRRWIEALPTTAGESCADGRTRVSQGRLFRSILEATRDEPSARRSSLRFVSLAHVWNACGARDRLEALRSATQHALNGLTWAPGPVAMRAVAMTGDDGRLLPDLLFAVALDDMGIAAAAWDRGVAPAQIAQSGVTSRLRTRLDAAFGTARVAVDADALAAAVYGNADTYNAILRLPETAKQLAGRLGIDHALFAAPSHRVDLENSQVTGGPRRLTRYRSRTTTLWLAGDGDSRTGGTLTDAPAAITATTRALFRLPNETLAFAAFREAPPGLAPTVPNNPSDQRHAPASCAACHAAGPRTVTATGGPAPDGAAAPAPGMDRAALSAFAAEVAGDLLPVALTRGLDPISFLMAEYEAPVDLRRAAAELGQSPAVLTGVLSERIANGDWLARRLSQGQISRPQFDQLRRAIEAGVGAIAPTAPREPGLGPGDASPEPAEDDLPSSARTELAVWTDRESYDAGVGLQIHLRAGQRCYPTVVNVDSRGDAIVLYPNGLDDWRALEAGQPAMLPPPGAEYTLRTRRGTERVLPSPEGVEAGAIASGPLAGPGDLYTLYAFCSAHQEPLFGMEPDYTLQVFTLLGNWDAFLKSAYETQAAAVDPDILRARQEAERRRSWRARRQPKKPIFDARPRLLMRDAATFDVR